MPDYRAIFSAVNVINLSRPRNFSSDHPEDAGALKATKQLLDGHEIELWDAGRLVARLSLDGEVASPELVPFLFPPPAMETVRVSETVKFQNWLLQNHKRIISCWGGSRLEIHRPTVAALFGWTRPDRLQLRRSKTYSTAPGSDSGDAYLSEAYSGLVRPGWE